MDDIYHASDITKKPKKYILIEFPYPSGEGLHMGHLRPYLAGDIYSRFKRMQGFETLFPIGWDAFGLPAENYALKKGVHPSVSTAQNIANAKRQLQSWGVGFDWEREINTTDPKYYKWTQWIFLQFYKAGLAYEATGLINWCPKDKTGLANEEVIDGHCERCGTLVEKKEMRQWYLKITAYAEKLLEGLKDLDWPEQVKVQQENWIGKSEGAEIEFPIETHPPTPSQREGEGIKRFVILHGRKSGPDDNFYPWLKQELEQQGFEVQVPQMPGKDEPDDEEQAEFVLQHCNLDNQTVLVGHSMGGIVALRLLEKGKKVHGVILVGVPYSGEFLDGKVRASVTAAAKKGFDFKKIKNNSRYFEVLQDTNDYVIPKTDGETFAKKLNGSLRRVTAVSSHFLSKEEPAIFTILTHPPTPSQREGENPPPDPLPKGGGDYREFGYQTTDPQTWAALQERVLEMRKNPTEAEEKLWQSLRKNLTGYHFRRQHTIGRFIVDFVCLEKSLVIEVDGDIHDFQKKEDEERTDFLKEKGYKVIRFRNNEVLNSLSTVVKTITEELDSLPFGEGRENTGGGVIKVFTTRPDTLFGATYMVLAPEHPLVENLKSAIANWAEVEKYIEEAQKKTDIARSALDKEKTGVELKGIKAINPATKESIPVWIADYVLMGYGTGAIMAVPQHDERDRQFAEKYHLPIVDKPLIPKAEAIKKFGTSKVQYKLRDWVFSRQRYWGESIPLIHCEKCGIVPVPEDELPVKLPEVEKYEPTGTGESPLASIDSWVNVKCPKCDGPAKRETNTMPQWAGSSWYWIRYTDPKNAKEFADKKLQKRWTPVDVYFGGMEHTTLHLLYARFWNLFLYDQGYVTAQEPFVKRVPHGIILGPDGEKMSKSRGNVVNPDDIVAQYGADVLRMYEPFLGPHDATVPWNDKGIIGVKRFLDRVRNHFERSEKSLSKGISHSVRDGGSHKLIKKITNDIEAFKFNTAIAAFMEFLNEKKELSKGDWEKFLILLAPFAPHTTEELWQKLGHKDSIHVQAWPKFDEKTAKDETVTIVVQVLGRVRASLDLPAGTSQVDVKAKALADSNVQKHLAGKQIVKEIFVQDKLINFVVR